MSNTITSHDGQAARLMVSIASSHAAQPALNTSTFRLAAIILLILLPVGPTCEIARVNQAARSWDAKPWS